jgi:hypothetical protein
MSVDEFKLAVLMALLFCVYTYLLRQHLRHNFSIFLLACATGVLAQFPLGRELNRYTPNITVYVSYVSLAVIVTWGAGLTSIYAAHIWLARICVRRPGFGFFTVCGLPILVILEFVGSNIIRMKLHGYKRFTPLMPSLNSMHAPPWLYAYYIAVAVVFFFVLKRTGIYASGWDCFATIRRWRWWGMVRANEGSE